MAQFEGGWKNRGLTDQERALDGRAVMAAQDSQRTFERIRAQVPRWSPERKSRLVTRLAEEGLSPTQIRQQITRLGVDPAEVEGTLAKLPQPVTAGAPAQPAPAPTQAATPDPSAPPEPTAQPQPSAQPEPTAQPSAPEDWSDLMRGLDESVHRKAVAERHAAERTVAGHLVEAPKAVARGATGALGETLKGLQLDADRMEHRRGVGPDRPVEEGRLYRAGEFFSEGVRERLAPHPAYEQSFVQQAAEGGGSLAFYAGLAVAGRGAGMTRGGAQYVAPALSAQAAGQSEAYQNVKQFMEENPERAAELGIDDEYALELSAEGRLPGIVQILSLGPILRRIPESMRPSASAYLMRRMGEAGATEYTVENAGALLQNLLRREYDEDHPIWDEVPERGETAAVGAAALQALLFPLQRRGARAPSATRDTEQDAPLDSLYGQEQQPEGERFERVEPEAPADADMAQTPMDVEQPAAEDARFIADPQAYGQDQDGVDLGLEAEAEGRPEPAPTTAADDTGAEYPTQEIPVAQLELSEDVPQFKRGADDSGVVEPLGGQYERLGTAPILVWEREDGRREVVTGRHRLDLARRTGEQTIPAQVVREADGFSREDAMVADAEMNIRDGQGEVADYAAYFKQRGTDEAQAQRRGLLERAKGRDGFTIASQGSDTLYQLHQGEQIGDRQAAAVARAAPNDERLQALGIERIQRGENIETATSMMQAVQAMGAEGRGPEQVDMFGLDDSAMRQAEELAKKAAARQREISEDIRLLRNPSKNPQRARELGIDVQDETGARERLRSLEAERERWQRWHTDPELRQTLLQETQGEAPAQEPAQEQQPPGPVAEGQTDLLGQAVPEQREAPAEAPAPEQTDMIGGATQEQQRLHDEQRAVDERLSGGEAGHVPAGAGEGALFDGSQAQTDIADAPAAPELVYKADGSPYPTQAAARAAARSRKLTDHTPEQVGEGAWALRPPEAEPSAQTDAPAESTAEPSPEAVAEPTPEPQPAAEPAATTPSEPFTPTHEASDGELVRALEDEDGVYVNQAGEEIIDPGARPLPAERQQPVEAAEQPAAEQPAAEQPAAEPAAAQDAEDTARALGLDGDLYHGTAAGIDFDRFDAARSGSGVGMNAFDQGDHFYLTESRRAAELFGQWAENKRELQASRIPPDDARGSVLTFRLDPDARVMQVEQMPRGRDRAQQVIDQAQEQGYDAIAFPERGFETVEGSLDVYNLIRSEGLPRTLIVLNEDALTRARDEAQAAAIDEQQPRHILRALGAPLPRSNESKGDARKRAEKALEAARRIDEGVDRLTGKTIKEQILAPLGLAKNGRVAEIRERVKQWRRENPDSALTERAEIARRYDAGELSVADAREQGLLRQHPGAFPKKVRSLLHDTGNTGAYDWQKGLEEFLEARGDQNVQDSYNLNREVAAGYFDRGEIGETPAHLRRVLAAREFGLDVPAKAWAAYEDLSDVRAQRESRREQAVEDKEESRRQKEERLLSSEELALTDQKFESGRRTRAIKREVARRLREQMERASDPQVRQELELSLFFTDRDSVSDEKGRRLVAEHSEKEHDHARELRQQLTEEVRRENQDRDTEALERETQAAEGDWLRSRWRRMSRDHRHRIAEEAGEADPLSTSRQGHEEIRSEVLERLRPLIQRDHSEDSPRTRLDQMRPSERVELARRAGLKPSRGLVLTGNLSQSEVETLARQLEQESPSRVDQAAAETDTDPSEAQAEAGNYRKGQVSLHGLEISIENPRGSTRSGTAADGTRWETTMADHYGYIRRSEGADGDHVDVFLGRQAEDPSLPVFIVNQVDPQSGAFDEHKVMLGYPNEQAAREGYLANYEPGWQGLGSIEAMDLEGFKAWVRSDQTAEPADSLAGQLAGMDEAELSALFDEVAAESGAAQTERPQGARAKTAEKPDGKKRPRKQQARAEQQESVERTAAEIAKSMGGNLSSAGQEAVSGLAALFGAKAGRLSSGLSFDENTYQQAKPHFQAMLRDFQAAGKDLRAFIRAVLDNFGTGIKPYVLRFARDLQEEQGHGDQDAVSAGDGGAGTAAVPGVDALREDGGASEQGLEAGARDVSGTDRQRAEVSERGSEAALQEGGRGDRARDVHRVRERPGRDPQNFTVEPGGLQETRGPKQKARDNLAAIELIQALEAEGRPATPEEQAQLARYIGWGGLKGAFPDAQGEYAKGYRDIGTRLRELLSDTEYRTAERSLQYAHYTSETVTRGMWDLVRRLGFDGGQVFEPGMGVGNFPATMPADVAARTHYAGLELDHITARIARALYPRWGVRQDDFTRAPLPRDTFDLVIGNPPFADIPIRSDSRYPQGFLLHDYFFAKSLDAVRPGGLLAFVTSAGTMNKADASAREYLADRADLVGAIRLPGAAFEKTAHTSVTTDIVVLRKRLEGEPAGDRSWTETVEVTLPNKHGQSITGRMSRYFADNPDMILGEQGFFDPLYENRYAVRGIKGQSLDKALERAIEQFPENVMAEEATQAERAEIDFGTDQKKDGSFYFDGERLMQLNDGVGVPVQARGKGQSSGLPKTHIERIRGLVPIRDALRAVYAADLAGQKENAKVARQRLNEAYDAFVERFGPINKLERQTRRATLVQKEAARAEAREEARYAGEPWFEGDFDPSGMIAEGASLTKIAAARQAAREAAEREGRTFDEGSFDPDSVQDTVIEKRENIDPFKDDPENYRLRAIEEYNDETGEAIKSGIFFEDIITRERAPEIRSVNDAMLHVLNRKGRLDIPEIAALAGKSQTQTIEELGESIFKLPGTEDTYVLRDAYLSGNVREKLRQAEAAAAKNPEFERNVAALEAVQPVDLTPSEINAALGAPWIPEPVLEQFATEALGLRTLTARYTPKLAYWEIRGDKASAAATSEWGTADLSATELIEHAANRRTPQIVRKEKLPDGSEHKWVDSAATQAAQDKLKGIKEKFSAWAWEDEGRAAELAEIYNEQFNSTVVREYDGSYLTTPGVSSAWQWRPHQKRVIARIIQSGNTYMAHGVGAGKTSAMIGAGMEMRRLGLVNKPMYVVPNHMLGQFAKEFYEQYPTARIAVADERRFHTNRRKQFIANVANEDLDAIIITHSSFFMIPMSDEFQDGLIQQQLDDYRELLEQMDKDADNRITRGRLQKQIERLEQRLTGKADKATDQVFTFEEMGVDFLFVDEAHTFRKLDFATKMSSVKGITSEGSKASWDLYAKSRYLEGVKPGQNLVLASGTAVTNTMAELYTISRYLQPQELEARGLSHFDAWAGAFGDTATELEQDAAGNYKSVTRFAKFVNVPELSQMVRQNMDVVTSEQLAQYVTRPRLRGGKRQMHLAERSAALIDYQDKLAARMKAIENRKGPAEKGDDILLSIIGDGRHAAIDMRLADPELSEDPGSKLNLLVENVADVYHRTGAQPFYEPRADGYSENPVDAGPATQMVFADLGLSGKRGLSVPNYIRAELARRGVPRSEIADIRDYKSHAARQRLFNDMNEGKVRVLIGSTAKMGTGVNAQRRLYAVHNLDPLWFPADDEQRNGRIRRQGNMNPEIEIHDYSTKGTYDATMWQMMERKARFIEAFFRGDPTLRDMDDLGEASQYEQAKALSTADPRVMQLTELRQDLEREQRRKDAHQREQSGIRQRINRAQMSRQASENRIPRIEQDIAQRQDTTGDAFRAQVGDQAFTDRLEAGQAMLQRIEELKQGQGMAPPKKIGEIGGFDIMATVWGTHERFADVGLKRAGDYSADVRVTGSARGLVQSLEYQLRGFESEIEHHRKRIAEAEQEIREYESRLGQEYDGAERLEDLQTQVRAIEAELARESQDAGQAGGGEERYARGPYHDPWIGMVPRQGPSEHYTQRQGDEADWHHSMVVVDMDAYDADDTLRYVRYGDAHEVRISGSPALAPYGRGRAQIRRMATEMIERGTPGDVRLRVDDMALGHEMEGVDLGALRDWAEGPSLARSSAPGQGLLVEQARRHVAAVSAGWDGPRLETVQSVRDLPGDIHALAEQAGALEDMRGVYYRGVIYLVADRHDSAQALERTLLHEAVGHYGLRNLLGTRIRPVLNQVWAATGGVKGNQSIIDSYFQPGTFDPQNATHRAIIAEERLAQMAEDGTHAGIIERAVAALREWLRGLGLTIRLNDADLRALLRRAHRSLEAQTPDQMAGEAAFARRGQEGTEALDRQRQVSEGIRKGAPVDRMFSAVFDLTGSTDEYGRFRPGVQLTEQIRKTLHERTVDPEGTFGRWLHPLVERARAGLIDRYGVPESFIQRDAARESESRRILGQMEGLVEQIQKADLSREERLVLQRVLDEGEVPTEALESLSVPIRAALDDLTGQMIELGLMKADSAITDWLHRSYQKHEAELSGLPKWMHQAQRKHRKKIGGDSLRMRGLKEEVTTERLLRNVPRDWWGRKLRPGQADTHLVGTEWVMLDRLEHTPEGMDPLTGMDPAQPAQRRVRERVFWPADRELPARFDTWENRGTFEVAGTRGEKLILRRDFTRAEREDMGQVLDVRYNLIKSFQLLAHDISSARFFSDIAKNPDWATMEPTTETGEAAEIVNAEEARRLSTFVGVDWVRVPETRVAKGAKAFKWGDLAGMYVRPEIWRDLNELDIMQTPGTWRKLLTHWKLNKTARSPVVHVNNVMSNLGLMDLIDVRVRDLAAGIREFAHKGPMYQEAREHGAFGGTFVHQEIQRDVLAPIVDEMLAEARRGEESMGGRVRFLSQLGYRLWDGVKKADRRMVDFYQVEDEIFRMGTYMRLRGMGMDAPEAARQARVQFLDYNIRAPWVNAARQSVLPFISYTYRAAPAIATAIAHRPWKLAKYITIGYLTNLLAFELEPGDEDEERRTMRPEVQGMTWASIPFTDIGWNRMVRLPWRDQYDNPMYIDIMRWVPAGDVFDTQQGVTGVPAWLQMGGPLQIGFELYLNKQNFTGQEIYDPLASDWQDRLNARIGYLWRAYVPSGAYIPGSWHNASLMSALRGERDLLDRPASIPQSLASGVGIKARGHDVDLGYWFRSMEIDQRRRALHAERRALERDYRRNAISYPAYNRAVRRIEVKTDHLSSTAAAIAPR
ncbi:N-6 DNA methylase [Halorhodospira sp. 9621]|uniref:N-6 DNA methylase n=1 Tax=Halorhodospira sp. 9621 TaxID=2899135 RepID=UPI001EE97D60|nr:N-6 DNA methylase [Halorhodospira sp. 9621]MCG5533094.1 N-6 DNA methylase [Halorhodospira sp. 9621]